MIETYGAALLGGVLIGGAASLLLFTVGYPVGISGFLSRAFSDPGNAGWRWSFLVGMVAVALLGGLQGNRWLVSSLDGSVLKLVLGAVFVGAGARMAGGCTSGHSLCGMARVDMDSIVATAIFIVAGAATVAIFGV